MFAIMHNKLPVASLEKVPEGWKMQYISKTSVSPFMPPQNEPYITKELPRFLISLLPKGSRRTIMAKSRHIDEAEISSLLKQCLTSDNVGCLRLVPAADYIHHPEHLLNGGIGKLETPAPAYIPILDENILNNEKFAASIAGLIEDKTAGAGIGGAFPKAFVNTPNGQYLMKKYPDMNSISGENIAKLEKASLTAFGEASELPHVKSRQIGGFLLVERFDRGVNGEIAVAHMADGFEGDIYSGSYEKVLKALSKISAKDNEAFAKQVMFAWVLGDSDHHLENFALLGNSGNNNEWKLAPAYDFLPSRLITRDKENLALTINGKKSKLSLDDFKAFGKLAGLSNEETSEFLNKSLESVVKNVLPLVPKSLVEDYTQHLMSVSSVIEGNNPVQAEKDAIQFAKIEHRRLGNDGIE